MSYRPTSIPLGQGPQFKVWITDELAKVAQAFDQLDNLDLVPLNSEPVKFAEGLIIYADGSGFDPGFGAGPYFRSGGGWVYMADQGGGGAVTSFNARLGAVVPIVGDYAAFYAPIVHTHVEADITDLQPYLLDAPIDGNDYGRRDGAWEIIPTGGVTDHGALTGLADDDHSQYAFLAGRAGGQTLVGGTLAGEALILRGSASSPDVGIVEVQSPFDITYDTFSNTTPAEQFAVTWSPSVAISGGYVGGFLSVDYDFTVTTGLYIPATFSDTARSIIAAVPGFSAYTFVNCLHNIENQGNFNLPAALIINVALAHVRTSSGTSTTPGITGLSFAAMTKANVSGAIMTKTAQTGLNMAPIFSTVAGSTVNLGDIRAVNCVQPIVGLFQPQAGVENMASYTGLNFNAMTFGGASADISVIRSSLAAGSGRRFLNNLSTAQSEFGAGSIHLNDNAYVMMGATILSADVIHGWSTAQSALTWSTFFGVAANPLYLRPTAADEWTFQQANTGLQDIGLGFNCNAIVFGTTAPTPNSNNWFVQFAAPNLRTVQIGGEYSDVLWTAGGSIDVDGNTVSNLQAFKINSPAVILNGGTIDDISNLFVEAMPSFGATRTQALRVLGRSRLDGRVNLGSEAPAQITADQDDYQLGQNNNQRSVVLLDSDDDWNITGIDSSFGFAQTGDTIRLFNDGAFNLTLTDQDTASLAANRFAFGQDVVIQPGESVTIWYDDQGATRWRIFGQAPTVGGLISGNWKFRTDTGAADPGAGRMRYNNATPASVTAIYVDQFTDNGGDAQNILAAVGSGDQIYIQESGSSAAFLVLAVTSVVDNTGWFTINGTISASGALPGANRVCLVSVRFA